MKKIGLALFLILLSVSAAAAHPAPKSTAEEQMIAVPAPDKGINDYGPPEVGHGLTAENARDGWISLFDGQTTFGWQKATIQNKTLTAGDTTTIFGTCQVRGRVAKAGTLRVGNSKVALGTGVFGLNTTGKIATSFEWEGGALEWLQVKPLELEPLFNRKDLTGWKRIDHPKRPKDQWPAWTVKDGVIHALGGPGALEYQGRQFGDVVLQVEARSLARYTNGGLFLRSMPGQFMNGYETQIHNRCVALDPAQPFVYATGGIDDRQNARRLISRDGEPFVITVIMRGTHMATWVNGYQVTDWTDTRAKHDNPRQGLRLEAGTLQLQAHDTGTNLEFRRIEARAWD